MKQKGGTNDCIIRKKREVRLIQTNDGNMNSGTTHSQVIILPGGQQMTHSDEWIAPRFTRNPFSQLGILTTNEELIMETETFLLPETLMTPLKSAPKTQRLSLRFQLDLNVFSWCF